MVNTLERMRRAVALHAAAQPAPPPRRADLPPIAQILGGDWHETAEGPVFVRDDWYPPDHVHGAMPLSAALKVPTDGLRALLAAPLPPNPQNFVFFDIETTGLSGGTGTYIVLAGLGSFEDGGYRLRQYFLADIRYERAMLAMLAADLARFEGVVTYNGRAFDIPFVEARLTLARLRSPCPNMIHLDLLHPVRRLYKHRMPGCRLAEVERKLLRVDRPDDIPGSLIPALYFDYVRAGRAAPLRGVFRHNAEDVLSLGGILAALAGLLSADDLNPDDAAAVARWWEAAREPERAGALYRYALPWLEGGNDWGWAASRHAALCKRADLRAEALPLWHSLWNSGDAAAGVELAKHYEHHARDLEAAARITAEVIAGSGGSDELSVRLARIRRKLASREAPARRAMRAEPAASSR